MGEMLTWTNRSIVERWSDAVPRARCAEYDGFKSEIETALMRQFERNFPDVAQVVVFRELATPVSTQAITGHHKGPSHGLDVTPKRGLSDGLHMRTPFESFYLDRHDVVSPGDYGRHVGRAFCSGECGPEGVCPHAVA